MHVDLEDKLQEKFCNILDNNSPTAGLANQENSNKIS
jgi:hypothetical protein